MHKEGDIVIIRELSEMENLNEHPKFIVQMYKLCGLYAKIERATYWVDEKKTFYELQFHSKHGLVRFSFTDYMLKPYEIQKR